MKRIALAAMLLGSAHGNAESYTCEFPEGTEIFTRINQSFLIQRSGSDTELTVDIIRETPSAIFLLEDFQHQAYGDDQDTGSFLLRVIDNQLNAFIWNSQRFTDEKTDFYYRVVCLPHSF